MIDFGYVTGENTIYSKWVQIFSYPYGILMTGSSK